MSPTQKTGFVSVSQFSQTPQPESWNEPKLVHRDSQLLLVDRLRHEGMGSLNQGNFVRGNFVQGNFVQFEKGVKLGGGVFGDVFALGSKYAMKKIKDTLLTKEEAKAAQNEEVACINAVIKRLAKVPGLREMHTLLLEKKTAKGLASIVNVKCEGYSLDSLIQAKSKQPGLFAKTTNAVLRVLSVLHGAKPPIFHTDIKPDNLMLCDGVVKVIDFGLCTYKDTPLGNFTPTDQRGFLNVQEHTDNDLYALGVTLHLIIAYGIDTECTQYDMKFANALMACKMRTAADALTQFQNMQWNLTDPRRSSKPTKTTTNANSRSTDRSSWEEQSPQTSPHRSSKPTKTTTNAYSSASTQLTPTPMVPKRTKMFRVRRRRA